MLKSFCAGAALVLAAGGAVVAAPIDPAVDGQAHIILVAGGCGPGYHRGPMGGCRPNRGVVVAPEVVAPVVVAPRVIAPVRLPPPCPRGYYRDPDPARPICYPRF